MLDKSEEADGCDEFERVGILLREAAFASKWAGGRDCALA